MGRSSNDYDDMTSYEQFQKIETRYGSQLVELGKPSEILLYLPQTGFRPPTNFWIFTIGSLQSVQPRLKPCGNTFLISISIAIIRVIRILCGSSSMK